MYEVNTWPCDSAVAPAGPMSEWPVPISSLRLLRGKYISVCLDRGRSSKWLVVGH